MIISPVSSLFTASQLLNYPPPPSKLGWEFHSAILIRGSRICDYILNDEQLLRVNAELPDLLHGGADNISHLSGSLALDIERHKGLFQTLPARCNLSHGKVVSVHVHGDAPIGEHKVRVRVLKCERHRHDKP